MSDYEDVPLGIVWDRPEQDVVRARVIALRGMEKEVVATIHYTPAQAAEVANQLLKAMR